MNILLIDDEPEAVKDILEFYGFNVEIGINGYKGLELLQNNKSKFDLVILDIVMPKLDGWEVLKTIRADAVFSKIPVIMLTSKTTRLDVVSGLKQGADLYLTKPFHSNVLLAHVEALQRRISWQTDKQSSIHNKLYDANQYPSNVISEREKEILQLVGKGNSNQTIAETLFITERTVKNHIVNIMRKLNANNRAHAACIALNHKLIQ